MKKKTLIPLSVAAVAALFAGNVNAKTLTTNEVIEGYSKDGSFYNNVYVVGGYIFQDTLSLKDLYIGAQTSVGEPIVYHLNTDGTTWTDTLDNEKVISVPSSFDLDKARLSDGTIEDLTDAEMINALNNLENEVKTLKMEEYTSDSYKALENAMAMNNNGSTAQVRAKMEAITAAKNALVFANKAELDKLIKEVEALKEEDYTAASYKAFTTAYGNAKKLSENSYANIDNKITKINECVGDLVIDTATAVAIAAKSSFDTELAKHYAASDFVEDPDNYTDSSWDAYSTVVLKVKDLSGVTISEYKNATQALKDAYAGLVLANKANFEKTVREAQVDYDLYTALSSKPLKDALEAASKVTDATTNDELGRHIDDITAAKAALVKKVTEEALSAIIVEADEVVKSISDYTDTTTLPAAINAAKAVVDQVANSDSYVIKEGVSVTDSGIIALIDAIDKAIADLEFVGLADFKAELKKAKELVSTDYTTPTWTEFVKERKIIIDKDASGFISAADVAQYTQYLADAVAKLSKNAVDAQLVSELKTLVTEQATLVTAKADYTVESWKVYNDAYTVANGLLTSGSLNAGVTTSQVEEAIADIKTAKDGLLYDKDNLIYAIDEALKIKNSAAYEYYNQNTKSVFESALNVAINVRDNSNDKGDIDKAISNLNSIEFVVDKTVLKEILDSECGANMTLPSNPTTNGYTTKSFTDYTDKLTAAKAVYDNANATSAQIVTVIGDIETAKDSLIHASVEQALLDAIDAASNAEITEDNYGDIDAVTKAGSAASTITDGSNINVVTTEAEVQKLTQNILKAIDALVPVNADTLATVKEAAKKIIADNANKKIYTDESIEALKKAVASGNEKTYTEVAKKIEDITTEQGALVYANAAELAALKTQANAVKTEEYDKTNITAAWALDENDYDEIAAKIEALKSAIAIDTKEFKNVKDLKAFEKLNDENIFTAASWTTFKSEYDKIVRDGDHTTFDGVATMITAVEAKAADLVNAAKAELKKLYDDEDDKGKVQTDYVSGWSTYEAALTATDTLLNTTLAGVNDYELTDEQRTSIAEMIETLKSAKAGLVKKTN